MYCLRLFIVVLQELHCLLQYLIVVYALKSMCVPCFVYIAIYVPIVMYGLRLFLQELHCLLNCLHICMIRV